MLPGSLQERVLLHTVVPFPACVAVFAITSIPARADELQLQRQFVRGGRRAMHIQPCCRRLFREQKKLRTFQPNSFLVNGAPNLLTHLSGRRSPCCRQGKGTVKVFQKLPEGPRRQNKTSIFNLKQLPFGNA